MKEIVIKLDNVDYEYIKNGCIVPIKIDTHIYDAIRNGKVLPKGHGNLKDEKQILERVDAYCECNCKFSKKLREFMCRACATGDARDFIEDAETVVEADKGEE